MAVTRFIQSGIDPEATYSDSPTPLLQAARIGHPEVCLLLLEAGANPRKIFFSRFAQKQNSSPADLVREAINRDNHHNPIQENLLEIDINDPRLNTSHAQQAIQCLRLIDRYQKNPLSLKALCINKARQLVSSGKLTKDELAVLPADILNDSGLMLVIAPEQKK